MSTEAFHHIIGRALTEPAFRESLLRRPTDAIREYPFSPGERDLLLSLQAGTLEELAGELWERLNRPVDG